MSSFIAQELALTNPDRDGKFKTRTRKSSGSYRALMCPVYPRQRDEQQT